MVGQDFCKCPPGVAHPHGIGMEVVRDEDQRLPERPAAPARPGGVVHPQRGPKDAAALGGEGVPRHHQIAGRIAYAQRPKVDNGAQPTLLKEQIPWQQIPVEPDRGAIPILGCRPNAPPPQRQLQRPAGSRQCIHPVANQLQLPRQHDLHRHRVGWQLYSRARHLHR